MTILPDELEITQEDREAAADIARIFLGNDDTLSSDLRSGELVRHWLLTELARHRERAMTQAAEAAAGRAWQPIETAPRDGGFVLLHVPKGLESGAVTVGAYYNCHGERNEDGRFAKGWWDGWLGMDADIISSWCEPTHWMPLPAPPNSLDPSQIAADTGEGR